MERRVAGPLWVVLVRDRCAEERHDAVARVLVDRSLEAMDAFGEDLEEAIHDPVPFLRIDALLQLHRALDVGEQHRHLLAFALEGRLRLEDLVGEVPGGVVARGALVCRRWGWRRRCRRCSRPDQDVPVPARHLLNVDQLVGELGQLFVG